MPTMHQLAGQDLVSRSPAQTAFRGATIAVIDDDDDTREVLCTKLSRAGYCPVSFDGGKSALEAMDQGVRPDLILLDLVMPGMNGWEFRVAQKQRPAIAQIPAVALSGDVSPYAAAIDASARLTKPVDVNELCDVIDHLLTVTERRQQTLRNVELDRGRALGMLVASVAHEINNPLTYVSGNIELALQELGQGRDGENGNPLRPLLEAARDGTQRVAFIVRLLSTFVHSDEQDVRVVDPLRALDAATRLAMHYIRPRARLVFMPGLTPLVRANEARLAQIFLNLLVNAAQSIPEGQPARHEVRVSTDARPGKAVIEVSDTGHGIPAQLHTSIFEPFATATADAASSGAELSLAITRAMVERLGGKLTLVATDRPGSTFRIELPAVDAQPQPELSIADREHSVPPVRAATRVLVIDDEPLVGRLVEAALVGHEVDVVTDPAQGMLLANDGLYDVVLCDLKMPDISGIEVYARLAAQRPDLCARFVLMTGAAADAEVEHFVEHTRAPVLRKPFAIRDLRNMVQRFVPARVSAQ